MLLSWQDLLPQADSRKLERAEFHDMAANMKPIFQALHNVPSRCIERQAISTFRTRPFSFPNQSPQHHHDVTVAILMFANLLHNNVVGAERSAAVHGKQLKHDGSLDRKIGEAKELQTRTPWHREGTDQPPVKRLRSAGAMTKGNCHRLF